MIDFDPPDNSTPLVSVVIPCYNQGRFLSQAIDSVLRQTWRHVEIIVVDDGSTDETADVIARYSMITVIRQTNQGLSAARNAGLNVSHGECVVFLDSDDLLLPVAIEAGMRELATCPDCAFVWGAFQFIDKYAVEIDEPIIPGIKDNIYLSLIHGNHVAMHAAVLYRRSIFKQIGGFDPFLSACEGLGYLS